MEHRSWRAPGTGGQVPLQGIRRPTRVPASWAPENHRSLQRDPRPQEATGFVYGEVVNNHGEHAGRVATQKKTMLDFLVGKAAFINQWLEFR